MKNFSRNCLLILTGLAINSCAIFSKARVTNLPLVHFGQTPEQLVSTLGSPKKQLTQGKSDIWFYDIYSEDSSRVYPYTARFENGILTSFNADYGRGAEDRMLCEQRKKSNQEIWPIAGTNGAPELKIESCGE